MWNKLFRYNDDKWPIKARYNRFAIKVWVFLYRAFFRYVTAAILEPQTMKLVSNKVLYWVRPCFIMVNCKYAGHVKENTIDASGSCGLLSNQPLPSEEKNEIHPTKEQSDCTHFLLVS